jgi:hypothetical protein
MPCARICCTMASGTSLLHKSSFTILNHIRLDRSGSSFFIQNSLQMTLRLQGIEI